VKRFVRILVIVSLLLAVALLASSVGVVMPRSFRVVGPDGTPAAAWVAYVYRGHRLNFVDSISWTRTGGIVHGDRDGVVRLPALFYFKRPLDGWLHHDVRTIYAPAQHATLNNHRPEDGAVLKVSDNTADPAAWDGALRAFYSLIAYDLVYARPARYAVAPETVATLVRLLAADYRALLAMHDGRRRAMPTEVPPHLRHAPEHDRAAWREQVRRQIEREPTWGAYLERMYAGHIAKLEAKVGR